MNIYATKKNSVIFFLLCLNEMQILTTVSVAKSAVFLHNWATFTLLLWVVILACKSKQFHNFDGEEKDEKYWLVYFWIRIMLVLFHSCFWSSSPFLVKWRVFGQYKLKKWKSYAFNQKSSYLSSNIDIFYMHETKKQISICWLLKKFSTIACMLYCRSKSSIIESYFWALIWLYNHS